VTTSAGRGGFHTLAPSLT
jgi:hypothetical protein